MTKRTSILVLSGIAGAYIAGRCGVRLTTTCLPAGGPDTGAENVLPFPTATGENDPQKEAQMRRFKKLPKKYKGAIIAGALGLASVGVAGFVTDGTGPFGGEVSTPQALVVTAVTSNTPVAPGGPAGSVAASVQNPNGYPVTVSTVDLSGPVLTIHTSPADASCNIAGPLSLVQTHYTGLSKLIPANGTSTIDLPGAVTLAANADPSCAGVAFTVSGHVIGS